jgi:hypothetical protein
VEILSDISWRAIRLNGRRHASKVEKAALPQSPNNNRQQRLEEMKQLAEIMADIYTNILGEPEITDSSMMADNMAA